MVGSSFTMEIQCLILCANRRLLVHLVIVFGPFTTTASDSTDATSDYAAAAATCMEQHSIVHYLPPRDLATASCGCPQRAVNAEKENLGVPVGHVPRY